MNDMADRMDYNEEQRALLKQKGIFPYVWFDSAENLEHPSFPDRKAFDSVQSNEAFSQVDYARAQQAWSLFEYDIFEYHLSIYLAGI